MFDLLKNEIIINWVAPIITGLIVFIIPVAAIKIFRLKKDEKTINQANQRFIDSIMPFIIQKIKISNTFISDIRKVIIEESNLKDKYVYSELELGKKLILDISESKYIDEERKKELIDFTYSIFNNFKNYKNDLINDLDEKQVSKKSYLFFIIILVVSQICVILIAIFDKRGVKIEDNYLALLPFLTGIFSVINISLISLTKNLENNIIKKKYQYRIHSNNNDLELFKKFHAYFNKKNKIQKKDEKQNKKIN